MLLDDGVHPAKSVQTILVVEDSEACSATLELALQARPGLSARFATTAEEAINMLNVEVFSVIITDLQLPGANGYELLEHVRSHPAIAGVPIIVTSGDPDAGTRERVMGRGANAFFKKPYSPRAVLDRVVELLH